MNRVDHVLRAAAALADAEHPIGRRAREAAVDECGLSPVMADHVLRLACARYTPDAVAALTSATREGRHVTVLLAATVSTAPLRAVALPWLAGAARVSVRASRRQRALVTAFVDAFAHDALRCVEVLPDDVDDVVAYGNDETIAALASSLAAGARFEGHGHGFGVAYVAEDRTRDEAAAAVARDVVLYDQRGCLSPAMVFAQGDAVAFAKALHVALGALEAPLPRGRVDLGDGAAVVQWQGVMAARARWFRRGVTHAVGALAGAEMATTPGLRNVVVCPVRDEAEAAAVLGDAAAHVTCVGVAGPAERARWPAVRGRVVAAGTMQDPPLDGPEDARG